jgi:hypothetical protein
MVARTLIGQMSAPRRRTEPHHPRHGDRLGAVHVSGVAVLKCSAKLRDLSSQIGNVMPSGRLRLLLELPDAIEQPRCERRRYHAEEGDAGDHQSHGWGDHRRLAPPLAGPALVLPSSSLTRGA